MSQHIVPLESRFAPISRRRFLGGSAVGIASSLLALNPTSTFAAPRRIRVGFHGVGYSHFKEKLRLIQASADFEWIGACEPEESVRKTVSSEVRWLSQRELHDEAEVVIVEGAVKDHSRYAIAALEAGRHVHVEKPPSSELRSFQTMVALALKHELILQVGYMWRYNPGFQKALEAAQRGWLGDVYLVRATMNTSIDATQRREWARFRGGAMFEQGCHLVDVVVRLLGRPSRITSFLNHAGEKYEDTLADNTLAVFEYPNCLAVISSAPLQPNAGPHRFLEILGTRGTAKVQPIEPPELALDLSAAAGPYARGIQTVPLPAYQRYTDEFRDLAAAVRRQGRLPVSLETEATIHETLLEACRMKS